jgi:RNA polymerase sigma-70 factor (ECF subfamily)
MWSTSWSDGQRRCRIGSRGGTIAAMSREPVDWFEVVAKLEAGDDAALLRLTGLVASLLTRVGAYRGGENLEDVVQEVTLALVEAVRRGAIEQRERFVGYAWSVARNRWINHVKARQRRGGHLAGPDPAEVAASDLAPGAPGALEEREPGARIDLERALAALPLDERCVIDAIYLQGQSYAEAAAGLGVPLGTLKRRQWNGLRLLRQRMQVDGGFS